RHPMDSDSVAELYRMKLFLLDLNHVLGLTNQILTMQTSRTGLPTDNQLKDHMLGSSPSYRNQNLRLRDSIPTIHQEFVFVTDFDCWASTLLAKQFINRLKLLPKTVVNIIIKSLKVALTNQDEYIDGKPYNTLLKLQKKTKLHTTPLIVVYVMALMAASEANFKNYNHNNVLEGNGGVVLDKYDDRGGYGDCDDGGRYSNCDDGGTYSNGYDEGRYKDFDDAGGYKNFEDGGYGPNYD
ncbi:hypothetical protein MJO29_006387, partial [Puccinia striiformis f. sp. tritici]